MYTDLTGCFPVASSSGIKSIMVLIETNGNYIGAEPMKIKIEAAMIKAYLTL
jgi:hypothetical protein